MEGESGEQVGGELESVTSSAGCSPMEETNRMPISTTTESVYYTPLHPFTTFYSTCTHAGTQTHKLTNRQTNGHDCINLFPGWKYIKPSQIFNLYRVMLSNNNSHSSSPTAEMKDSFSSKSKEASASSVDSTSEPSLS